MRIASIYKAKAQQQCHVAPLPVGDASQHIKQANIMQPRIRRFKEQVKYYLATPYLALHQEQIKAQLKCDLPFRYDLLCFGHRFSREATIRKLLSLTDATAPRRVLVVGCSAGDGDVQFWLRQNLRRLDGIDIYNFGEYWQKALPVMRVTYNCEIEFRQATVESLPYADESFDLISSDAVLEHVQNTEAAVQEMARVTMPGGLAWHKFGPLYFSYGGDHCMPAYGHACGYDHLLQAEETYQSLIHNQQFFAGTADPDQSYWARINQFSFLEPSEYLEVFSKYFSVEHVLAKISPEAVTFRERHPDKWRAMLCTGVAEASLLVDSLSVVLRKKA